MAQGWRVSDYPGNRSENPHNPWLLEISYSPVFQIVKDLVSDGREVATSRPSNRVGHAVSPRVQELDFQQGGPAHLRLQFVELHEPSSSKVQG